MGFRRLLVVGTRNNYLAWIKRTGRNPLSPNNAHIVEARYIRGSLGVEGVVLVILDNEYPLLIGKEISLWKESGGPIEDYSGTNWKDGK